MQRETLHGNIQFDNNHSINQAREMAAKNVDPVRTATHYHSDPTNGDLFISVFTDDGHGNGVLLFEFKIGIDPNFFGGI